MRTALSLSLVASALLYGLVGCGATSGVSTRGDRGSETDPVDPDDGSGTDPDAITFGGTVIDAVTVCERSPDFGFQIAAAAAVPSFESDLAAGILGEAGALALAADLTSAETFCDVDVALDIQQVLDEADLLAAGGRLQEAQTLIDGLLTDPSFGLSAKSAASARLTGAAETRRRVKGLLRVAAWQQMHGGTGTDAIEAAAKTFYDWAATQLDQATIKELLSLAAEAQLLGNDSDDLGSDAWERAVELSLKELQDAIAAFDPCTADVRAVKDLLGAVALTQLMGADQSDAEEVFDLVAQAARQLGSEALEQLLGREDVDDAICSGLRLVASSVVYEPIVTVDLGTCNTTHWTGTVTVSGGPYNLIGTVELVTPEGGGTGDTIATVTDTLPIGSGTMVVTDPLSFSLTVDLDARTAVVQVRSTGAGTYTTDFGTGPWAPLLWGPEISGPLTDNPDCPQNN